MTHGLEQLKLEYNGLTCVYSGCKKKKTTFVFAYYEKNCLFMSQLVSL